jgi:2-polyprenyl-6-hydroxyphenyl methylase/3-demethylubiquinone-9 3-methyltransferase
MSAETKTGDDRGSSWDHTSHKDFYEYYAAESQSEASVQRFRRVQTTVLRIAAQAGMSAQLDVADIGCGAGTQSRIWAELGHRPYGLDVNEPLIELARKRADESGLDIRFEVGTATALPWAAQTMDVCLLPELLEHVADWRACLIEAVRVLRPGGLLYISTTNVLCPNQQEFNLPLYSWYPAKLKRYCERLAVTTRPAIASYAKYPAVNWFSFYSLRDFFEPLGFQCLDRFALIDPNGKGKLASAILEMLRHSTVLRFLGHVATPGTYLVAVKSPQAKMKDDPSTKRQNDT